MFKVEIPEETLTAYKQLKMKRVFKWIIFKIDESTKLLVEASGEPTATFAAFVKKMPKDEPRYAIYDMEVNQPDGRKESKILFFLYAPEAGSSKTKFVYAGGKDSVTKSFGTVHKEYQINDYFDLNEEKILKSLIQN